MKLNVIICDVPAKAFITYTKGHAGYDSCSKCTVEGDYVANRMCFAETGSLTLRTDHDYRLKVQMNHHCGTSLLEDTFPLDYMHLVCLGVVKKFLASLWCYGKPSTKIVFKI